MSKHRTGRPDEPLLTPALIEEVSNALRHGCTITTVVKIAGVSKTMFYHWLDKGAQELEQLEPDQEPQAIYGKLVLSMERARGEARLNAEQWLHEHKPDVWLARHPETRREWGDSAKIDLQATVSASVEPLALPATAETAEDLSRVFEILLEIGAIKPESLGLASANSTPQLPTSSVAQDQELIPAPPRRPRAMNGPLVRSLSRPSREEDW